jgi:hypothetical protein
MLGENKGGIMKIPLLLLILLVGTSMILAQSHNLQQTVKNWPTDADTLGKNWIVYNLQNPNNKWLTDTSVGSATNYVPASNLIVWNANLGNFPGSPPWSVGDSIISFGSWDSAYAHNPIYYGNNINHTGFYWLFSDTITSEEPQLWLPADTIRPLPQPIALLQTNTPDIDSIIIKIPNPRETRRKSQEGVYDVLGYELYAAENIGTPNNLIIHVAYVPRTGTMQDTTIYKEVESNYLNETIYYAYKLVTRPDTTGGKSPEPGYTSLYFSQNSNPVNLDWPATAPGYMNTYLSRNSDAVGVNWSLGIGLTGFEASPEPYAILLSWSFANTEDVYQYVIQRSNNREMHYEEITRMDGTGSSPSGKRYSYRDNAVDPHKVYYYKLGVIMTNSDTEWFGPVSARITGIKTALHSSPNPMKYFADIQYAVPQKGIIDLSIHDVSGRIVRNIRKAECNPGIYTVRWDAKDNYQNSLPSGVYYCRLSTISETVTVKILHIR